MNTVPKCPFRTIFTCSIVKKLNFGPIKINSLMVSETVKFFVPPIRDSSLDHFYQHLINERSLAPENDI